MADPDQQRQDTRGALEDITGQRGQVPGGVFSDQAPQPIGVTAPPRMAVPPTYYPHGFSYSRGSYGRGAVLPGQAAHYDYYEGDEALPANWHPSKISEIQRDLAYVGLLPSNAVVTPSLWDENTKAAFHQLLAYANQRRQSWRFTLDQLKGLVKSQGRFIVDENGNLVPAGGPAQRPPLLARQTDPRTLELAFRDTAMQLTGEGLRSDEVRGMVDSYRQMEFQRQQEAWAKEPSGGVVTDIPSATDYAEAAVREQFPEEVEDYMGLQYLTDALQFLASPAWGVGG